MDPNETKIIFIKMLIYINVKSDIKCCAYGLSQLQNRNKLEIKHKHHCRSNKIQIKTIKYDGLWSFAEMNPLLVILSYFGLWCMFSWGRRPQRPSLLPPSLSHHLA